MSGWIKKRSNWIARTPQTPPPAPAPVPDENAPLVIYIPALCPHPGCGAKGPVYASRPPIRYHRCSKCGKTFASVEEDPKSLIITYKATGEVF